MVCGQHQDPGALPTEKTQYPQCRRLVGAQGLSGRMRKISPPTEFDPQTVQPFVSRYLDYTIPAHKLFGVKYMLKYKMQVKFLC